MSITPEPSTTTSASPTSHAWWKLGLAALMFLFALFKLLRACGVLEAPTSWSGPQLGVTTVSVPDIATDPQVPAFGDWRVNGITALNNVVLASTSKGYVLASVDAGTTWAVHSVTDADYSLSTSALLSDGRWAVLVDDSLAISSDLGVTWQRQLIQPMINGQRRHAADILLTTTGILSITHDQQRYRSADLGKTWELYGAGLETYYSTASAVSADRATTGSSQRQLQKVIEQQMNALSPYGAASSYLHDRYDDEDIVHDATLQHWIKTKEGQVAISHDFANTFSAASLTPPLPAAPSTESPATTETDNYIEPWVIYASAIADDGSMAVAVFATKPSVSHTGTLLDDIDHSTEFHLYASFDSGKHFNQVGTVYAHDVGGVSITDVAQQEFVVLHNGLSGITVYRNKATTTIGTGGFGSHSAVKTANGIFTAGSKLVAIRGKTATFATADLVTPACQPTWLLADAEHNTLVGITGAGCLASSIDGGTTWTTAATTGAQWSTLAGETISILQRLQDNNATAAAGEDYQSSITDLVLDKNQIYVQLTDVPAENFSAASDESTSSSSSTPAAAPPSVPSSLWLVSDDRGAHWASASAPKNQRVSIKPLLEPNRWASQHIKLPEGGEAELATMMCNGKSTKSRGACLFTTGKSDTLYLTVGDGATQRLTHPYVGSITNLLISTNGQRLIALAEGGVLVSHDQGKTFAVIAQALN